MDNKQEVRTISQLISYLEEVKKEEGDIAICNCEEHEYWVDYHSWFTIGLNLKVDNYAQPDGPKSGKSMKALVFG